MVLSNHAPSCLHTEIRAQPSARVLETLILKNLEIIILYQVFAVQARTKMKP
jgi:hypothetical protein